MCGILTFFITWIAKDFNKFKKHHIHVSMHMDNDIIKFISRVLWTALIKSLSDKYHGSLGALCFTVHEN